MLHIWSHSGVVSQAPDERILSLLFGSISHVLILAMGRQSPDSHLITRSLIEEKRFSMAL